MDFTRVQLLSIVFRAAYRLRRSDLAVLWDIRVQPERRGRGVGKALFYASVDWACRRGCRQLKVETQNVNVAACRFYASQG
jgi:GNAT superfamily N-acetyltransferase